MGGNGNVPHSCYQQNAQDRVPICIRGWDLESSVFSCSLRLLARKSELSRVPVESPHTLQLPVEQHFTCLGLDDCCRNATFYPGHHTSVTIQHESLPWVNSGRNSADYIALYHGNAALLAESLEVIQKTSAVILSALETHAAESEPEASKPPATERDGAGRTEAADILKKTA